MLAAPPTARLMNVRVVALRPLTPRIRELVLARPDGGTLPPFEAGAHVELHLDTAEGPLIRRYSLVTSLGDEAPARGHYRIAVQREGRGRGSDHLHDHVAVGTALRVSHPHDEFRLDRRDARSLLLAGGIGVTPLIAMAHSLLQRRRAFDFVYAGRSAPEMAYLTELQALCGERLRVHADDAQPAPLDVQILLAAQPAGTGVYVCGPAGLVRATHEAAERLGWAPGRVRSELFGPPALTAPTPFGLELRRSGRMLSVGPHASILEAMRAAGLQPLFDCGRGECGLCTLPVLQADGPLQHRDRCLTPEQRAAGDRLCICVSRLQGSMLVLDA